MYKLISKDGEARRGEVHTAHGTFQTPAFMPVGTYGAVKSISPEALNSINAEIILSNTYHLMERPGVEVIKLNGGLHNFMSWDKPILTDSGGYQVFSLAKKRKITEEGIEFNSALNGNKLFLNPEKCMDLQLSYGVDIAMVLDECTPYPAELSVAEKSMHLSLRWAQRSRDAFQSNNSSLFGIIQGGVYKELRRESAEFISSRPFFGHAIGGCLGAQKEQMYDAVRYSMEPLRRNRPVHLLGIGGIRDIWEGVEMGIDTFDCVTPTRIARHGWALSREAPSFRRNLRNAKFREDDAPLEEDCDCIACRRHNRAYIHHLLKANEILGLHLLTVHNIRYMTRLLALIRAAILADRLLEAKQDWLNGS